MGMSNDQGSHMSDINVTPLVDVMLVLLIIFMVTAPMLNNAGVEIDLPKAEAPPITLAEEQLVLSIDGDMQFYLNDIKLNAKEIEPKLTAIAKANPDQPVYLKADGGVPYREVAQLLAIAKRSGMPRVGMVFEPGKADEPGRDEPGRDD